MSKTKWTSDPAHSELSFKIRHLMISNVSGSIKNFHVETETQGDDFSEASVTLIANMSSLTTDNEQRDTHLHATDFFEVDKFPELKFQSTKIEWISNNAFTLYGKLTLKGITKPISLNVEFGGMLKDPHRGEKAGFTVTGKIKRSDWGVSFNRVMETGELGLGEEVRIISEIQLIKQSVNG